MTKYRWDEKGEAGRQDYGFRMIVRLYPAIRRTPMKTVISEDKRQFTIGLDLGDRVWLSGGCEKIGFRRTSDLQSKKLRARMPSERLLRLRCTFRIKN
jgi:hypothetical protein